MKICIQKPDTIIIEGKPEEIALYEAMKSQEETIGTIAEEENFAQDAPSFYETIKKLGL